MPTANELPPRDLPDRVIRESLQHPANLRAFLRQAVPQLADGFDCNRAHLLEREFPLDDWRHREADLPFEIPYRSGTEELTALVLVLIEHQSDTDPLLPLRLLYFAVTYWDRQWREWEKLARPRPPLRLHPVVPLVLYTGPTAWGSNRTLADLLGEPDALHVFAPSWQPLFWNLADQTPEVLLASGEEWLQMLAVIRAQGEEAAAFAAVFGDAVKQLASLRGRDHVRWYDLMRIVLTWAGYRRPAAERPTLLATAVAGQSHGARRQEIQTMTQTIAEAWIAEGEAKGEAKGRAEGKVEGQLQLTRKLLGQMLEDRFGPLPAAVIRLIESTTDVDRLAAAIIQTPRLQSLDQLPL